MKRILLLSVLSVIALALVYTGVGGVIDLISLVVERAEIAANGSITEGEFQGFQERGVGRGRYRAGSYRFFLEGRDDPEGEARMRELVGAADYDKTEEIIRRLEKDGVIEPRRKGAWFYGEDFSAAFESQLSRGSRITVTYLSSNPRKSMAGDRRGSSVWGLLGSEWILVVLWIASAILGTAMGLLILGGIREQIQLKRRRPNQPTTGNADGRPPQSEGLSDSDGFGRRA